MAKVLICGCSKDLADATRVALELANHTALVLPKVADLQRHLKDFQPNAVIYRPNFADISPGIAESKDDISSTIAESIHVMRSCNSWRVGFFLLSSLANGGQNSKFILPETIVEALWLRAERSLMDLANRPHSDFRAITLRFFVGSIERDEENQANMFLAQNHVRAMDAALSECSGNKYETKDIDIFSLATKGDVELRTLQLLCKSQEALKIYKELMDLDKRDVSKLQSAVENMFIGDKDISALSILVEIFQQRLAIERNACERGGSMPSAFCNMVAFYGLVVDQLSITIARYRGSV